MKVILLQDVKKVGKKGETVEVSIGYANNFLFPKKLAVMLTAKSEEILEKQNENHRKEEEQKKVEAIALGDALSKITLEFKAKVGKDGKMFGAISLKQVEEELKSKHNIQIDKRKFVDKTTIDCLGYFKLKIELYKGVFGIITVHVNEEK
ncbi:MAG: 50S ribosomal protein L9 [Erysipelotrichaceae bacterium]|nr:50S ribosomal protein L9 [Erysipelotrichaceae bacterium]